MFWGITPALDFIRQYHFHCAIPGEELNILIVGGADSRHVLQTIARRYRHRKVQLNFYIVEGCVETLARQLLLLYIALQPEERLGQVPKTRLFMELYGNTLIRPATAKYLSTTAAELVKMVTNYDYLQEIMPNVSIDVKYKERDYLENLLKFWCSRDDFDICQSWDRRLRKMLGVRYDSRLGAFDWDLHMRLKQVGGNQVCNQEYRSFRQNGIAFTWLESEVSKPNRSLVCVIIQNGEKMAHYGYMGDMQTGPFITYGLTCEDEKFLKATNGQNAYRATDVTERNLMQIFHEIEFQKEYHHRTLNDTQLGTAVIHQSPNLLVDFRAVDAPRREAAKCLELDDVNIKFMSISMLNLMKHKEEYKKRFNVIYFGSSYLKYIDQDLLDNVSAEKALMMIENQKYIVNYRDKDLEEFSKNVDDKLFDVRMKKLCFDLKKDDYIKFISYTKS